jgi:hypothetical protein
LSSNRLFELLRVLRLYPLPTFFDLRILNSVLDRWSMNSLRSQGSRRRRHIKLIALAGLTVFRSSIGRPIERKLNLRYRVIGPPLDRLHPWTEVVDHVVVGHNVRDVSCLPDDLDVALRPLHVPCVARFAPMSVTDESVSSWSDAIIRVGPGRNRPIRGDVCFGWERRPAHVFRTFPPGDPGRGPLISWNPTPSVPTNIGPSAVVVGGPGKTFAGVPVPAVIGPNPVSVSVRSPIC